MRLRLGALMITLLLGLTACAGGRSASGLDAKYRSYYAALTGFSGRCTVTVDYGTKVYEYELALAGDLTQGEAEVTAPENIAGVRFQWADEDGTLVYDGVTLETGELSPDGSVSGGCCAAGADRTGGGAAALCRRTEAGWGRDRLPRIGEPKVSG